MHQELQQVKQAPAVALKAQASEQPVRKSVLLAGLIAEGVSAADAAETVQAFLMKQVQPRVQIEVVSVSRMGSFSAQGEGDRRLRVDFASEVQAQAVLTSGVAAARFWSKRPLSLRLTTASCMVQKGSRPTALPPSLCLRRL